MRAGGVVMLRVFLKHGAQVSLTDDEHPVGALSPDRLDPVFCVRVHFWALRCRLLDLDAFGSEDSVERVGELAVAVTDQEAERCGALAEV